MPSPLQHLIISRIRERGPLTAAEFIELALYHPDYGYYSSAPQRSGRRGDFITSVEVGPLFGEMLAVQLEEMWRKVGGPATFDVVEAGAGNGRLMRDVLDAARALSAPFYESLHVTLVERSRTARAVHADVLAPHTGRLMTSQDELPTDVRGAIIANELLDAMPVHLAVMSAAGLREIYVTEVGGQLREMAGDLSTAAIADCVSHSGVRLDEGSRVAVPLEVAEWLERAARSLLRGFLLLIDYGRGAQRLGASSPTLTTHWRHTESGDDWLCDPGERDITTHLDLTWVRSTAEAAELIPLGATDQTYFLMALGITDRLSDAPDLRSIARRRAAKSLILPEGFGGTQKVLVFGKNVGCPALRGLSKSRLT